MYNPLAQSTVVIDCFPESALKYRDTHTIVAVDVIRASTTVATALSLGRRVLPVRTTDEAFVLGASLNDPLFAGELGGNIPYGFEISNSPAEIASRSDNHRPMVFISSSGTQLILNSAGKNRVYIGCFRNMTALCEFLKDRSRRIAVLGAGTRGQFRREDQMGCAWIAEKLVGTGFAPSDERTAGTIKYWHGKDPDEAGGGRSADYLRRTGQERDLDFIMSHIDDLNVIPELVNGEILKAEA